jgi:hypothetical protein
MTKSILKSVLIGVLFGTVAFFMPKLLVAIIVFSLVMKLLRSCCGRHSCCGGRSKGLEMMDEIRSMSDAEYAEFVESKTKGCCRSKSSCC